MKLSPGIIIFITVFLLLAFSAIPLALIYHEINANIKVEELLAPIDFPPSFVTSPPSSVQVGESLNYRVRVADQESPTEDLIVLLEKSPDWILYDGTSLVGIPTEDDIGAVEIDISLSDGNSTVHQNFYLLITEDGE
jgi:hypothetical protein